MFPNLAVLGRGKGSIVYFSKGNGQIDDVDTHNQFDFVAIKQYYRHSSIANSTTILTEKKVLKQISASDSNNYLIKFFGTQKDDSFLYFIFEPVLGGSIHQHIHSRGSFELHSTVAFLSELISVLYFLFCNQIIHRDLKANNILLDLEGHVKLCDFGFAHSFESSSCPKESICCVSNQVYYLSDEELTSYSCKEYLTREYSTLPRRLTFLGTDHALAPEMMSLNQSKLATLSPSPVQERTPTFPSSSSPSSSLSPSPSPSPSSSSHGYSYLVDWWGLGILGLEMISGVMGEDLSSLLLPIHQESSSSSTPLSEEPVPVPVPVPSNEINTPHSFLPSTHLPTTSSSTDHDQESNYYKSNQKINLISHLIQSLTPCECFSSDRTPLRRKKHSTILSNQSTLYNAELEDLSSPSSPSPSLVCSCSYRSFRSLLQSLLHPNPALRLGPTSLPSILTHSAFQLLSSQNCILIDKHQPPPSPLDTDSSTVQSNSSPETPLDMKDISLTSSPTSSTSSSSSSFNSSVLMRFDWDVVQERRQPCPFDFTTRPFSLSYDPEALRRRVGHWDLVERYLEPESTLPPVISQKAVSTISSSPFSSRFNLDHQKQKKDEEEHVVDVVDVDLDNLFVGF